MRTGDAGLSLEQGLHRSGMSHRELWLRYVGIGGDAGELELEAYLLALLRPSPLQYDLIAQAINEHFIDHGGDHPVRYADSDSADGESGG